MNQHNASPWDQKMFVESHIANLEFGRLLFTSLATQNVNRAALALCVACYVASMSISYYRQFIDQ